MAAANGHVNIVKFLVLGNPRIKIDITDNNAQKIEIIRKIRDTQGHITTLRENFAGNTPLLWAMQLKQWETAAILIIMFYDQIDVLQKNQFKQSAVSVIMNYTVKEESDIYAHLMNLVLEHPSAAALETPLINA